MEEDFWDGDMGIRLRWFESFTPLNRTTPSVFFTVEAMANICSCSLFIQVIIQRIEIPLSGTHGLRSLVMSSNMVCRTFPSHFSEDAQFCFCKRYDDEAKQSKKVVGFLRSYWKWINFSIYSNPLSTMCSKHTLRPLTQKNAEFGTLSAEEISQNILSNR